MNAPLSTDSPRRSRRPLIAGVTAGLLAGGAIGLAATMPSITSAASDDATVTLQDDTADDTTDAATDQVDDERPEPGERLRELLQPLVDDGTINAAQADAVTTHLVENRPERDGRIGRRGRLDGHGRNNPVLADLLGIDRQTLRSELEAGKSIADIAEENGVDVQAVIDGLVADAQSHIDLAIDHGLDEEAAAERLEKVTERIEEGVHRTRPTDG